MDKGLMSHWQEKVGSVCVVLRLPHPRLTCKILRIRLIVDTANY
jgi:hypothetical protein